MYLLQESKKRSKIIKEKREVLNERIRVAENRADVGWTLIRLDESTRGTVFENLVHGKNDTKHDRTTNAMRQSRQESSSTLIQSVIRTFLHRRRFCRHLERKRDARVREAEQLKRLAEHSPRSWRRACTPDGKTYYYDMQTGCRAWRSPKSVNVEEQDEKKEDEQEQDEESRGGEGREEAAAGAGAAAAAGAGAGAGVGAGQ